MIEAAADLMLVIPNYSCRPSCIDPLPVVQQGLCQDDIFDDRRNAKPHHNHRLMEELVPYLDHSPNDPMGPKISGGQHKRRHTQAQSTGSEVSHPSIADTTTL